MRLLTGSIPALAILLAACSPPTSRKGEVVVYSSVDDVYARPVAERFQQETGVTVRFVPDTEETKSTGLVNRLIAERKRPQADVFWSGDPVRAALLKSNGVSAVFHPANAAGLPRLYQMPPVSMRGQMRGSRLTSARRAPRLLAEESRCAQ